MSGKVILITGGAGAIGSAAAEAFLREDAHVIIADSDTAKGEQVLQNLLSQGLTNGRYIPLDLRQEQSISEVVEALVAEHGRIDCLINNAATFAFAPLESWDSFANFDTHYQVGLRGHALLIQKIWQYSPQSKAGSIINISSVAGHVAEPDAFAYTPIKAALKGLTLSCSIEMARAKGWAVTLSPGHTWSPAHQKRAAAENLSREDYEISKSSIQDTMFGTFLEPDEVARWIVLLASPLGKGLTGQDIHLTSGLEIGGANRSYRTSV